MPTVSVIMPAYNVAPYVGAAIESVLAQTYGHLELIIVNDGSTDGTVDTIARHAGRDARIRVLNKANGGISSARNEGLRAARGELVALLDGDDVWDAGYLAAQLAILEGRPEIDIVTANAWNLGGRSHGAPARPWPDPRPHPDLLRILGDEEAVFIMSVFRRRVYEAVGEFDESLRTNEDYDYWLRAAAHGFRFWRNDRPLGRYRRRDDSLSASQVKMLNGIQRVYAKLRPRLMDKPAELAVLDRQVARFETESLKAEACEAIQQGDMETAAARLDLLRQRRGDAATMLAHLMARWTPGLLARAYHFRVLRREAT